MSKTGVVGNGKAASNDKQIRRIQDGFPYKQTMRDNTIEPENRGEVFTKSNSRRNVDMPPVPMGRGVIGSDSRTKDLVSEGSVTLNHHGDRMDEHGGFQPNTDFKLGNTLDGEGRNSDEPWGNK